MLVQVRNRCSDYDSYRAARVKSLFNAESGANFALDAELAIEDWDWRIGAIVGPSGSGKTSLGALVFAGAEVYHEPEWPGDAPIVDAIGPGKDFNDVTAALAAVGLGDVPSWLRPYAVLSNGEKFRASLARVIADAPQRVVIDEFTSVVDRQIAKFGALAFQKAWRRTKGQAVLLTPHYDVLEWVEPDWIFDTATRTFDRRRLQRPSFDIEVWETDWRYWPAFEPHHYLKIGKMIAATNYVATVDGELVAHLAVSPAFHQGGCFRASRLVVMPEWQGAGVGMRFLNHVCERHLRGENRYGRPAPMLFHTSHPGLCAALRRDTRWIQKSAAMYGTNKGKSRRSLNAAAMRRGGAQLGTGYGGHLRAVQGFKYLGVPGNAETTPARRAFATPRTAGIIGGGQ
ncbi:MAG: GNAT family N-acetyltransferase [Thermoflexaceae bacterium]|nr:GNAT family N-acetyltransferase [Thermoflexaceae bacterium]